jgi:hypothetical protein
MLKSILKLYSYVHNSCEHFPLIYCIYERYWGRNQIFAFCRRRGRFPASISTALRSSLSPAVRPHSGEGYHGGSSENAVHGQACTSRMKTGPLHCRFPASISGPLEKGRSPGQLRPLPGVDLHRLALPPCPCRPVLHQHIFMSKLQQTSYVGGMYGGMCQLSY